MRNVELNELYLKNDCDEEMFYQLFLKGLKTEIKENGIFKKPSKEYEIFYLNILGGKIILLNKNNIIKEDLAEQELYYDYSTAYEIYQCLTTIYDGINDEQNEINELYKEERIKLNEKIKSLRQKDEDLFEQKIKEYNIIVSSNVYKEYLQLKEEFEKIKCQNEALVEQLKNAPRNNIGFFEKIYNKLFRKRLSE